MLKSPGTGMKRTCLFLFGSLLAEGARARDIDLILVAPDPDSVTPRTMLQYQGIAIRSGKPLDVFLIIPDWGKYLTRHQGWSGEENDLTVSDYAEILVHDYFKPQSLKLAYDPAEGMWSYQEAWIPAGGMFAHLELREASPAGVSELTRSKARKAPRCPSCGAYPSSGGFCPVPKSAAVAGPVLLPPRLDPPVSRR